MTALISNGKSFYVILHGSCVRLVKSRQCHLSSKFCFNSPTRYLSSQQTIVSDVAKNIQNKDKEEVHPLWYYDNKGMRQRKINQWIRKSIEVDKLPGKHKKVPANIKHMKDLLYTLELCDFKKEDVASLLFNKPKVFGLTKQELYTRLMDLLDHGYPKDTLKKMILKSPGLLLIDSNEQQQRINNLKELDLTPKISQERLVYLTQKCPDLLAASEKSFFQSKLKNLRQLGLNQQLVYELVMKHPQVLTYSENSVKEKINYVKNKLGGPPSLFVKFPRTFTSSLQRIRERHLYLKEEGYFTDKNKMTESKLRAIVLTTDKNFIHRVTMTTMKDFRRFQQQLRKEEGTEMGRVTNDENEVRNEIEDEDDVNDDGDDEDYDEDYNEDHNNYDADKEVDNENEVQDNKKSNRNEKYMDSFKSSRKKHEDDEDFYNTPFPPIKEYSSNDMSWTSTITRPSKTNKKKQYTKRHKQYMY